MVGRTASKGVTRLLVKEVHDVFHSGRREKVLLFNKQYYSKQVHAVAAEVCSSCPCAVAKATKRKLTHFDAIRKDTSPFEDVAIDTVGQETCSPIREFETGDTDSC
jgi:hypothetical protein